MTEPGLYWAKFNKPKASSLDELIKVGSDGNVEVLFPYNYKALLENFTLGPRIPTAAEIEEQGKWTDWPACPECHFPLVRHIEGEPSHENLIWTCPHHGEFLVKQRYRVIERTTP